MICRHSRRNELHGALSSIPAVLAIASRCKTSTGTIPPTPLPHELLSMGLITSFTCASVQTVPG
eukprot:1869045-Amphidinium_carterae.2